MQINLSNKRVAVVGAAGLLGTALVDALVESEANILAVDIDSKKLCAKFDKSDRVKIKTLDFSDEVDVSNFFRSIDHLDGAVNCAYPRNSAYGRKFEDVSLEDFNENVALNLGTSFCFSKYCVRYFMRRRTPFSLVNISSIYGVAPPKFDIYEGTSMTTPVEYAAIKSALIHLSSYISAYVRDSRFRINCVSPGGLFDNQAKPFLEGYMEHTRGKGMLDAADVIGAILFLLSDLSIYMTGQNLVVDDGFTL
jgi:NAD(P)-dependent dehydrogenase (short-subunit alcohol dehydrogenase family)